VLFRSERQRFLASPADLVRRRLAPERVGVTVRRVDMRRAGAVAVTAPIVLAFDDARMVGRLKLLPAALRRAGLRETVRQAPGSGGERFLRGGTLKRGVLDPPRRIASGRVACDGA